MNQFLTILFLFISSITFGQSECENFKNGNFEIKDPELGEYLITRSGTTQIEYGTAINLKAEFYVNWIDECTYTLKLKRIIENPNNIPLREGMTLKVEIIEVRENSYIQRSTSDMDNLVYESEIFVRE